MLTAVTKMMIPLMMLILMCGVAPAQAATKICAEANSCEGQTIEGFDEVVCSGSHSCDGASITGATLVTCSNLGACFDTYFTGVSKVICDGSEACYKAFFTGITATLALDCLGGNACLDAYVGGPANVQCDSATACHYVQGIFGGSVTCKGSYSCGWMGGTSPDCVTCETDLSCMLLGIFGQPFLGDPYSAETLSDAGVYGTCPTSQPSIAPTASPSAPPSIAPTASPSTSPSEPPFVSPSPSQAPITYCDQPCEEVGSCSPSQVEICQKNGRTKCVSANAYETRCEQGGATCGACITSLRRGDGFF